uniref:SWIRM domain-containing protein n=1 Tax=Graphocephala atropunctata TaxID=36148 RepID=A0A1B6M6B9_9HEMI
MADVTPNHNDNNVKGLLDAVEDKRLVPTDPCLPTHLKFGKPLNSVLWKTRKGNDPLLAEYNPFRGDFGVEYNNSAEEMLCLAGQLGNCIDKDDSDEREQKLMEELQIVLVEGYNYQLQERQKRKNVIKQLGLINQTGTQLWFSRFESALGKSLWRKLIRFSRLMEVDKMDYLYASLEVLNEKRALENQLMFHRTQQGITSKLGMEIYEMERKKRELNIKQIDTKNRIAIPPTMKRKKSARQIFHMPRYKELSPKEAELCSINGLFPAFYLNTKDNLISECKKMNGMRLKRARRLVKIDVNKTRKIFDLLMEQGLIWTPETENEDILSNPKETEET